MRSTPSWRSRARGLDVHRRILTDFQDAASVLKRAAVLFEHLFFDYNGLPIDFAGFPPDVADPHRYLSLFATPSLEVERPYLASSPAFKALVLTPRDIFAHERTYYEAIGQASADMDSHLLAAITRASDRHKPAQYQNLDDWWRGQKEMLGTWWSDFAMFNVTTETILGAVPLCSPLHLKVVRKLENLPGAADGPTHLELLRAMPPVDFSKLAWHDIFELRQDSRVRQFRGKLSEIAMAGRTNPASVGPAVWQQAFLALESLEDSVPRAVVEGVVTNLPSPVPINPLGVATSVRNAVRAHRVRNRHGWLLFLAEANRRIRRQTEK